MDDDVFFEEEIIVIPLNRCMARVQRERIFNFTGGYNESAAVASAADDFGGSPLWLSATKMYAYLWRQTISGIYNPVRTNDPITIIVPELRNIYWRFRHLLTENDRNALRDIIGDEFEFKDVYEYEGLKSYQRIKNVSEYHLIGTITQFDVLHIPTHNFVRLFNRNSPLIFRLPIGNPEEVNIRVILWWNHNMTFDNEYLTSFPDRGHVIMLP